MYRTVFFVGDGHHIEGLTVALSGGQRGCQTCLCRENQRQC